MRRLDLGGSCEAAEVQGPRLRGGVEMVAQIPLRIPVTDFIVLDKLLPMGRRPHSHLWVEVAGPEVRVLAL